MTPEDIRRYGNITDDVPRSIAERDRLKAALKVAVKALQAAADVRGKDSWAHEALAEIDRILAERP